MANYLAWDQITVTSFDENEINSYYNRGYVFTRIDKGVMDQTRSLRVNLSKFSLSSENRRILKKTDGLTLHKTSLPLPDYHWSIGKLGKDFYETKFGEGIFSANKIKELITDQTKSNFTTLCQYKNGNETLGYCIALETHEIVHYCYPFYKLDTTISNLGLGMMLRAITSAQAEGKNYVYLGSAQRPTDTYKLQFEGIEWFDGHKWQTDAEDLKKIITTETKSAN